jgi:hypothetical protein
MIDPGHPRLSIVRQCELASISPLTGDGVQRFPARSTQKYLRT